jgi:hypothetical protein
MATWPTIIDDDGSGTTGTPLDFALFQQVKGYIDAAPLLLVPTLGSPSYNDFQPVGGPAAHVWLLQPSVATAITGIVAEPDGTQHLLVNTMGNTILLANQHPNSAAPNRLLGPGFANYDLTSWKSIWMVYSAYYQCWILQKA